MIRKLTLIFALFTILFSNSFAIVDDAVSYYSFDENKVIVNTLLDSTINNYDGSCNNMLLSCNTNIGLLSNSTSFDGLNDYILIDSSNPVLQNTLGSFSVWIKPDVLSGYIFQKGTSPNGVRLDGLIIGDGRFIWAGRKAGGLSPDPFNVQSSVGAISLGVWTHVVGTYDQSGNANLYVNGVFQNSVTVSGTIDVTTYPLNIGRRGDGVSYYDGSMDEFATYDRVLNQSEVSELYNGGLGFNPYDIVITPQITINNPIPNFNYTFDVTSLPINIQTDVEASCEYDYNLTTIPLTTLDNLTHTGTFNLGIQQNASSIYDVTFRCNDFNLNVTETNISFYRQQEPFNLSIIVPQDQQVFLPNTEQIEFYLETNYVAICKYNVNNGSEVFFTNSNHSIHTTLFNITNTSLLTYNSYFQCDAVNLIESKNRSVTFYLDELTLIQFGFVPVLEDTGSGLGNFISVITSPIYIILISLGIASALLFMIRQITQVIGRIGGK